MNSDRGTTQRQFDFACEVEEPSSVELLRTESTDPASSDQPALDASSVDALLELIVESSNLDRAWRRVKRNRGAPGPDGITIKEFEPWARANWKTVRKQLLDGTYRPGPVRRKTIRKEGGGERLLGIPNVLDRLNLRAGVMVEGILQPTPEGSPQGGPLSPLLSNILLDDLDKELERRGLKFVRYADDFMIFVKSSRSAQRVFESVQRYLTQTLKLVVNQSKSRVTVAEGCEFLGFAFVSGRRATIKVAPKKLKAFKRRVKELTGRSRGISMKRRLTDLARYVRGWIGYFGLARQLDEFSNLDGWIRRRIRMCYWKQWRYPRTKVRHLTKLGVDLDMAIKHAVSRKSYWRMCRTPATRYAMTNKWLQEQGLFSLKQRWSELAPLRGTA